MKVLSLLVVSSLFASACTPAAQEPPTTVAATTSSTTIETVDIRVNSVLEDPIGYCELGTTVMKPLGHAPRALVVLIHGSGPIDRDGTIPGGFHPYRDIGVYLAEHGYASIRFDKRASIPVCAAKLKETLRADDFLMDVVKVQDSVRHRVPGLAKLPLVLLGHSEGVTYANEMTVRHMLDPAPRGLILMAGLGRYPLDVTLRRQLAGIQKKPGVPVTQQQKLQKLMEQGDAFFKRVRTGKSQPTEFYFGAYSRFWGDSLKLTDEAKATAAKTRIPALLLQGDQDENVTKEDFVALQAALAGRPHAASTYFPGLGHLFNKAGTTAVSEDVLRRLVEWLDELSTTFTEAE